MTHEYLLFYKPYMVMSQFSPAGDKQTLAHYVKNIKSDIYPVGRLDYDSEGLLLLTNDKALTHQLLTPKFAHQRTYYAQVEGAIIPQAVAALRKGVTINIDGKPYTTRPAGVRFLPEEPALPVRTPPIRFRKEIPTSWVELQLIEGKNRQVRRMTAAVGFPTLRLVRYAIGGVTIAGMVSGECHRVGTEVVHKILQSH